MTTDTLTTDVMRPIRTDTLTAGAAPDTAQKSEPESTLQDMIIEKKGEYIKLSGEISRKITDRVRTTASFSTHHMLMEVECTDAIECSTLAAIAVKSIEKSLIRWNTVIDVNRDRRNGIPVILHSFKPIQVITAARKTGVIPSSKGIVAAVIGLMILAGILMSGLYRVMFMGEPVSVLLVAKTLKTFVNTPVLSISTVTLSLVGGAIVSFINNSNCAKDSTIRQRIDAHTQKIDSDKRYDDPFAVAVRKAFNMRPMPMAVVIDNPEDLDGFTRNVLGDFLLSDNGSVGLVLWIIFRKPGKGSLVDDLSDTGKPNGATVDISRTAYRFVRVV